MDLKPTFYNLIKSDYNCQMFPITADIYVDFFFTGGIEKIQRCC